jgi:hypothetical protein
MDYLVSRDRLAKEFYHAPEVDSDADAGGGLAVERLLLLSDGHCLLDQMLSLYSASETYQVLVSTEEPIERYPVTNVAGAQHRACEFGIHARVTDSGTKCPGDTVTHTREPLAKTPSGSRSAIRDQSSPTAVSAVASASSGASGTFFVTNAGISSTSSALIIG